MGLLEIADGLYSTPPSEFTRARDEQVRSARAAGDAGLALRIKALRRPAASAWLVNRVARTDRPLLQRLADVGRLLRAAQADHDGAQLRRLGAERHDAVQVATRAAVLAAHNAGEQVTPAQQAEVSATFDAAVIDEAALAAVCSGRLLRRLAASGFEPVALEGAVAVPDEVPGRARLRAVRPTRTGSPAAPSPAQRRADDARERAAVSERALVRAEASLQSADHDLAGAQDRVRAAEAELDAARDRLVSADAARRQSLAERDAARRLRDAARRALHRADAAVGS
jgi:hypothetical protein